MKRHLQIIIISFFVLVPFLNYSQNKKPKVALVLSGGGAKGIAHIPTLQLLDSLGIVPDLIIGTSMGSVVGGLYAMGYSGDSIAAIANNANWNELFGGNVSLQNVSVEEKSEYEKYLVSFDWVKGKPKLKSSLLNDQNLREFLSILTYPVYKINNFDDLSIPFRAMATDIVNGEEVILSSGSLSNALRASMSIPSIFLPIPYSNTLLVDGGVLNNFPTDIAKSMGADFIIGSDVGGGMLPKEKLDNIAALAFQTGMLSSNLKNPVNRKLCDILIDHVPNLTYATGDFAKSTEIYEEGKIAANKNKSYLIDLANQLKMYNQKKHKLPYISEKILLDTIIFNNVSEANLNLVKARTNIQAHKKYSPEEISDGINRAIGTTIFNQITYSPFIEGEKTGIQLNGFEKSKHQIKSSLHYDTYRGVGLILNYTGRNIIGDASRFLINLDIAEQPGFRVQYQKNFGVKKDWWWRSEVLGQDLIQNFYVDGEKIDDLDYKYFQFENQFNKNIHSLKSYAGIGFNFENTKLKPTSDPEIVENVFDLKRYDFKNFEIFVHYLYNTRDAVFFPNKGTFINARLSRSIYHEVDIDFFKEDEPDISGNTNGFTKLVLNYEKRIPFHSNITGIVGAATNFTFADKLQSNDVSFIEYGHGGSYSLGGNIIRPRKDDYAFPGLNEGELVVSQFIMLKLGVQIQTINSLYLTPHFHIGSVGFENFNDYIETAFSPKGDWQFAETGKLMSAGITASYNSILGPINFDVSWVNNISKTRVFFGIGLHFNRSN